MKLKPLLITGSFALATVLGAVASAANMPATHKAYATGKTAEPTSRKVALHHHYDRHHLKVAHHKSKKAMERKTDERKTG